MKKEEIVSEKTVNQKVSVIVFTSFDGKKFESECECREYEQAKRVVLRVEMKEKALVVSDEMELYNGCGCEEHEAFVIVPKSKADIERLREVLTAHGSTQRYVDRVTEAMIGEPLVLSFDCEGDGCWIESLKKMVEKDTNGEFTVVPAKKAE